MPDISIEHATFERLKRLAEPLVDNADAVVCRALDALEENGRGRPVGQSLEIDREIQPSRLPNLTHTKILSARIGSEVIDRPNWNRLLNRIVVLAMHHAGNFERLAQTCPANMVQGQKRDDGYHFLREIGISVQGLSAHEACSALIDTARRIGINLEIVFRWREKEGAAHPGETGRLRMNVTTNRK